jgi:hypothetical protein
MVVVVVVVSNQSLNSWKIQGGVGIRSQDFTKLAQKALAEIHPLIQSLLDRMLSRDRVRNIYCAWRRRQPIEA